MPVWRLIDTGFNSGAFNMSLDETLFQRALESDGQESPYFIPALRVYGFHRPAITYGYSQKISKHWLDDPFYESAKRITGGGLVFHGKDLTYSFVGGKSHHETFRSLLSSYRAFHEVVQQAFQKMGIRVDFFEEKRTAGSGKNLCFLAPVKHDLTFEGKKMAGAAQKRSGEIFLHQGSVNFRVFLENDEDYFSFYEKFKTLFLAAFREYFRVDFAEQPVSETPGDDRFVLTAGEEALNAPLLAWKK